jgi:hypothetical protein
VLIGAADTRRIENGSIENGPAEEEAGQEFDHISPRSSSSVTDVYQHPPTQIVH